MQMSALVKKLSIAVAAVLVGLAGYAAAETDPAAHSKSYGGLLGGHQSGTSRQDEETVLLVSGVIGPGAHLQFRAALSRGTPKMVVLSGPGGVLGEALLIGEEVQRRHLATLVAAHSTCASACAVVYLSGSTKYLGAGANIGLHSASYADGRADPEATRLMADYLRRVGVPSGTLQRMAATPPSAIRWLSKAEQRAIGIKPYQAQ